MTKQEMFDKVLFALRKQKYRSSNYWGCLYSSKHGRCAVGHLFTDEQIEELSDQEFLSTCVDFLAYSAKHGKLSASFDDFFKGMDLDFLLELQAAHDSYFPAHEVGFYDCPDYISEISSGYESQSKDRWELEMSRLASRYILKYTPL